MRSLVASLCVGTLVAAAGSGWLGAQTAPAAKSAATDPVVISAGAEHLRASQFQALLDAAPAENRKGMESHKRAVADQLGRLLALANEAHRLGLDQQPAFRAQMMLARDNALAKLVVDRLASQAKPTEAQIQAYYTAHASAFTQTKLRHILIGDNESPNAPSQRTPAAALAKAQKVEAELKGGASFAALAKANSDDPGSRDKGGQLDDMTPGETVPEFEKAVDALPVGKVSAPIHTRFGYHIVEVQARTPMPMSEAKPMIEQQLAGEAVGREINRIAATSHLNISDSYFGPELAPQSAAPAK